MRHLLRLINTPRRATAACLLFALLAWSAVDSGTARLAATRVVGSAYAIYDPVAHHTDASFGPRLAQNPQVDATRLAQAIARAFSGAEVLIDASPAIALQVPQFYHEDPDSPAVARFRDEAADLLEAADLFELSNRLRSLTQHGTPPKQIGGTDPLAFLTYARRQTPLTCRYFAVICGALCTSQGYTTRLVGLSADGTAWDHAVCEVYAPEHGRWILVDPDFNIAYRRDGVWLNVRELQDAWRDVKRRAGPAGSLREIRKSLEHRKHEIPGWTGIEAVPLGEAGQRLRSTSLQGSCTSMNLEYFEYAAYAIRNDYLGGQYPWGHPARWKQFLLKADRAAPRPKICPEAYEVDDPDELYWPVGRSAVVLETLRSGDPPRVACRLGTWTPNFDSFEVRMNGGEWRAHTKPALDWPLSAGQNTLEVRSVNLAGLRGETARTEITITLNPES